MAAPATRMPSGTGAAAAPAPPHRLFSHTSPAPFAPTPSSSAAGAPAPPPSPADVLQTKGIEIAGFRVAVTHSSIAPSAHIDDLTARLAIPMPEMPFASNALEISHEPSGWRYRFDAVEALRCVAGVKADCAMQGINLAGAAAGDANRKLGKKKAKGIKVAYAEEWGRSRDDPSVAPQPLPSGSPGAAQTAFSPSIAPALKASAMTASISSAKDYDWTYSTTYAGSELPSTAGAQLQPGTDPSTDRIPTERLGPGMEPILFWDEVVLFEDELGDNGTSGVDVKVRVMPSSLLLLSRFFLRVDGVLFRIFDTRLFIDFAPGSAPVPAPQAGMAATARPAPSAAARGGTAALGEGLGQLSLGAPRSRGIPAAGAPSSASAQAPGPRAPPRVVRECSGCEANYKDVRARLPAWKPHDLSPLTDPGWVASTLTTLAATRTSRAAAAGAFASTAGEYGVRSGAPPLSAAAPARAEPDAAQVLGEVEEAWEGEGSRVDVVVLQ